MIQEAYVQGVDLFGRRTGQGHGHDRDFQEPGQSAVQRDRRQDRRLSRPAAGRRLAHVLLLFSGDTVIKTNRFGDFSYGTYLYAFPIQQLILSAIGHTIPPLLLFACATPATLCGRCYQLVHGGAPLPAGRAQKA